MIVSVWHDQREKPNNLKLVQRTKVLIHNQLADKVKARLPTFLHNLHLSIHSISLTFSDIHQIPTCRLFDSIQFCVVPFFVTHRIFLWAPLLFLLIVIHRMWFCPENPTLFWISCRSTCPWEPAFQRTNCGRTSFDGYLWGGLPWKTDKKSGRNDRKQI